MLISPYLYLCILYSDATVFLQTTYATQTLATITAIILETYQVSRRITLTAKQCFDLEVLLHIERRKRCG